MYFSQFTLPQNVSLKDDPFQVGSENNKVNTWMELITPGTAKVLASYDHPVWGKYAAVTQNRFGKGTATYIGCLTSNAVLEKILSDELKNSDLWGEAQKLYFPVITKEGVNQSGKTVRCFFNYSAKPVTVNYTFSNGRELILDKAVVKNSELNIEAWGMKIIEEQ
jgi:beta-galactosidase